MKLLDLFSGAGGSARGYRAAGFHVTGVDVMDQSHYGGDEFIQGDVMEVLTEVGYLRQFDAIHASPPCKVHTRLKPFSGTQHRDLVPQTRDALISSGRPYVIENVPGCPLHNPVTLCGSMFGLGVRRHRLFEVNWSLPQPKCRHSEQVENSPGYMVARYHSGKREDHWSPVVGIYGRGQGLGRGENLLWQQAMGIDWMTKDEMAQAIPPAYTEHIGKALIEELS